MVRYIIATFHVYRILDTLDSRNKMTVPIVLDKQGSNPLAFPPVRSRALAGHFRGAAR